MPPLGPAIPVIETLILVFEILDKNHQSIPEQFEDKMLSALNAEEVTLLIEENIL